MNLENSYISRVWNYDRPLVKWLVVIFLGGTVFINLIGHEITPFSIWSMLSEKMYVQEEYEVLHIEIDGEPLIYSRGLWDNNRQYLRSTMSYYMDMKENNEDFSRRFFKEKLKGKYALIEGLHSRITNDVSQGTAFEKWYKRYLERVLDKKINQLEIKIGYYKYSEEGKPEFIREKIFMD